jgi:hypothetical protein
MNWNQIRTSLIGRGYWDENGGEGEDLGGTGDESKSNEGKDDDKEKSKAKETSDEEARLLKEVMLRKEREKKAKEEAAKLNEQLKRFEGIDPDQVRELLEERRKAEEKKLEEKGAFEAIKKQMRDEHEAALQRERLEKENLLNEIKKRDAEHAQIAVKSAFSGSSFIPSELTLSPRKVEALFGSHFEYVDGEIVGYDRPVTDSNKVPLIDGSGSYLNFDDALKRLVSADPEKDSYTKSKVKSGAGSSSDKNIDRSRNNSRELTAAEKIARGLAERAKSK